MDLSTNSNNVNNICKCLAGLQYKPCILVSDADGKTNLAREIRVIEQMLYNCKYNSVDPEIEGYQVNIFYLSGHGFFM